MSQLPEDRPSPEEEAITQEQAKSLRALVRKARDHGIEAERDEEELLALTRGEADELLEELQSQIDDSRS